jgi:hypothetical protein
VPSQFSSLGFQISSGEDLAALATRAAERADTIDAAEGQYLKWAPPSGEQLWLQVTRNGDAMGMNPHFAGRSQVRVTLEARIARKNHTALDGAFLAWANPPADGSAGGDYPFAFDCPDAATHADLELPVTVVAQIAAFAQQVTVYPSEAACLEAADGAGFGSRAFIPSGLVSPSGEPMTPPESHALISGVVVETGDRWNSMTGDRFLWTLVESIGGTFDVVMDPGLVTSPIRAGNVVSGWFWLSGRFGRETERSRGGWLRRLARR